jgi:hypothetical protein
LIGRVSYDASFGLFGALGRSSIRDIEGSQETVSFAVDILISELVHGFSSRSFHQIAYGKIFGLRHYSINTLQQFGSTLGSLEISLCGAVVERNRWHHYLGAAGTPGLHHLPLIIAVDSSR